MKHLASSLILFALFCVVLPVAAQEDAPTPLEYAMFSKLAYDPGADPVPGWHFLADSNDNRSLAQAQNNRGDDLTGYYGIAFMNATSLDMATHVVIAHRGTNEFINEFGLVTPGISALTQDVITDAYLVFLDSIPQYFSAKAFNQEVLGAIESPTSVSFTGHSLGAVFRVISY